MSEVLVKTYDVFDEISEENKRLLKELIIAKKCLTILIQFKAFIDSISTKFKVNLDSNELKEYEELNENVNQIPLKRMLNLNDRTKKNSDTNRIIPPLPITTDNDRSIDERSAIDVQQEKIMKCPYDNCSAEFSNGYQFKYHCQDYHSEEPRKNKMFVCNYPECRYSCDKLSVLKYHWKAKHGPQLNRTPDRRERKTDEESDKDMEVTEIRPTTARTRLINNISASDFTEEESGDQSLNNKRRQVNNTFSKRRKGNKNIDDYRRQKGYTIATKVNPAKEPCKFSPNVDSEQSRQKTITIQQRVTPFCVPLLNNNKNQQNQDDLASPTNLVNYVNNLVISPSLTVNNQNFKVYPIQVKNSRIILPKEPNKSEKVIIGPLVTIGDIDKVKHQTTTVTRVGNDTNTAKQSKKNETNEKIMKCPYDDCPIEFVYGNEVKNHWKRCHSNAPPIEKMFVCNYPECNHSCRSLRTLTLHRMASHGPRLQCSHEGCDKSFTRKEMLKYHMDTHRPERFECIFVGCNKTFISRLTLRKHQNLHTQKKVYCCQFPGCDYKTSDNSGAYAHRLVHKTDYEFVCDQPGCQSKFKLNRLLTRHKLFCHSDLPKEYKCSWPGCTYAAHYQQLVKRHAVIHNGVKRFTCDWPGCEYRAYQQSVIRKHAVCHATSDSRVECTVDGCDKTFKTNRGLTVHVKFYHSREQEYGCDWPGCEYKTFNTTNLSSHRNVHTNDYNFVCHYKQCAKKFKRRMTLRRHLELHQGIRKLSCDWPECRYSTSNTTNLKEHKKRHSDETPYVCWQRGCHFSCALIHDYKLHLNKHNKSD